MTEITVESRPKVTVEITPTKQANLTVLINTLPASCLTAIIGIQGPVGVFSPAERVEFATALAAKQDRLISGTNIKTINNQSLLGEGDFVLSLDGNYTDIQPVETIYTIDGGTVEVNLDVLTVDCGNSLLNNLDILIDGGTANVLSF